MPITNDMLRADVFDIWQPTQLPQISNTDRSYNDHILRDDFKRSGSPIISLGYAPDPEIFSYNSYDENMFLIEALLVKEAGSNDYRIPRTVSKFCDDFLKASAADQHARSPFATMKYAVLYFRRSHVSFGYSQTKPNWHVDSGLRAITSNDLKSRVLQPSLDMTIHCYAQSNLAGTRSQIKSVENAETIFADYPLRADKDIQDASSRQTLPHERVLFNSYNWHTTSPLDRDATMAAARENPILANLVDGQGGVRSWVGLMYIPTEVMAAHLAKGQRIQEPHAQFSMA